MAQHRPHVPKKVRKRLIAEAGGKCANPGCPNRFSEIHHIKEWAVYQSHDPSHMLAVCPACHAGTHHGEIPLTDDTVYRWKDIRRDPSIQRQHLWVEPRAQPELWFGSFGVQVSDPTNIIALSPANSVCMQILDSELLVVEAALTAPDGTEVLRIRNNTVTHRQMEGVNFLTAPGQVIVNAPLDTPIVPKWLRKLPRQVDSLKLDSRARISLGM